MVNLLFCFIIWFIILFLHCFHFSDILVLCDVFSSIFSLVFVLFVNIAENIIVNLQCHILDFGCNVEVKWVFLRIIWTWTIQSLILFRFHVLLWLIHSKSKRFLPENFRIFSGFWNILIKECVIKTRRFNFRISRSNPSFNFTRRLKMIKFLFKAISGHIQSHWVVLKAFCQGKM